MEMTVKRLEGTCWGVECFLKFNWSGVAELHTFTEIH